MLRILPGVGCDLQLTCDTIFGVGTPSNTRRCMIKIVLHGVLECTASVVINELLAEVF